MLALLLSPDCVCLPHTPAGCKLNASSPCWPSPPPPLARLLQSGGSSPKSPRGKKK